MFQLPPSVFPWCCFIFLLYVIRFWQAKRANPRGLPFPPGPRPLPIIGNLHQQPAAQQWLRYTEWATEYGPVTYFRLFGQPVILLNTPKACYDLLDKRADRYSDRPRTFIMAGELMGWNNGIFLQPSGPRHQKYRKLVNSAFNQTAVRNQWSLQESGVQKFLMRLIKSPDQFVDHIRTSVSETIVMMTFGHEISEEHFPYVQMAEKSNKNFLQAAAPYTYAVDSLPIRTQAYLWSVTYPNGFLELDSRKKARIWNEELQELVHLPFRAVKEDLRNGTARPSYIASKLATDEPRSKEDEEDIMWSSASIYAGGVDTTQSLIIAFIVAMCFFPHIQTKAQAELDSIIGSDRLPTIADRERLPYIRACVKELMRWCPIVPLGLSHRVMEADYYDGYYIPKGATIMSNIWAISRDSSIYPNPDDFRPERFLPSETGVVSPEVGGFGFGRRICPGIHVAQASVFIYMARTLATFTISRVRDTQGNEIEPTLSEWQPGLITHPKPVECKFNLRSDHAAQLIGET